MDFSGGAGIPAASMPGAALGIDFDGDTAFNERREVYRTSGKIARTQACVETAEKDKSGLWTTVAAMAVFLM